MRDKQPLKQVRLAIIPFFLVIAFTLAFSILMALFYDRYFSNFIAGNYNTFCQDYKENVLKNQKEDEIDKELLNYQICKHPLKKKNFIWVMLDGFSIDQAKQIEKEMSKDIMMFKSLGPTYRQTGAMHESYFTGKPSLNLIAGQISSDNLAHQIKQSQEMSKLGFSGSFFPIKTLLSGYIDEERIESESGILKLLCGKKNGQNSPDSLDSFPKMIKRIDEFDFDQKGVHYNKDELEELLEKKYPTFEKEEEFNKNMKDCLITGGHIYENLTSNHSLIYYSSYTDSLNHAFSKSHSYNHFAYFRINKLLIQFMKYVQQNLNDTVLVISSDHGGQFFNGEDNFCNHGCVRDTNHGMLLIASNDTLGKGQSSELNYLNVMPTVVQYLDGVNLPLFNRGIGHPVQEGFEHEILPLHMKFVQLKQYYKKVDKLIIDEDDDMEIKYNNILKQKDSLSKDKKEEITKEYKKIIDKMQNKVIDSERNKKEYKIVYFLQIQFIIGLVYIIAFNFKKAVYEWTQLSFIQKFIIAVLLVMYFSDNILVLWVQTLLDTFYHKSFYVNIGCLVVFMIFFSFYDFSKQTIKQLKISFHKTDNSSDEEEMQNQSSNISYETVPGGKSDSLGLFQNGTSNVNKKPFFRSLLVKLRRLPSRLNRRIDDRITLNKCFLLLLLLNVIYEIYIQNDLFVYTKKFFMETVTKWHIFNLFNYSIFIIFYFQPKVKTISISKYQVVYYIILFAQMIGYDLIDLRYLVKKTPNQVFLCRFTTVYFFCGLLYNIRRGYLLLKQHQNLQENNQNVFQVSIKNTALDVRAKFFTYIHLDIAVFVFYISDEIERIYLILFFFSMILISKKINFILNIAQAQKGILNQFIINFFLTVIIFKNAQFIYTAFKGTLTLDINLQSGNKTIGEYQDQTPIYTAILFGIDKMLVIILAYMEIIQLFIRVSIKQNIIKFDNASKGLMAIILIKIFITGLQLSENFFNEDSFLSIFIWFASITVFVIFSFVPYAIFKVVLFFVRLTNRHQINKQSSHVSV